MWERTFCVRTGACRRTQNTKIIEMIPAELQLKLAGNLVDHIIGSAFFGLDVDLAGLDTDLVGGAVVGLGTVNDIGHIVLLAAELHVQFRRKRGTAAARCEPPRNCAPTWCCSIWACRTWTA